MDDEPPPTKHKLEAHKKCVCGKTIKVYESECSICRLGKITKKLGLESKLDPLKDLLKEKSTEIKEKLSSFSIEDFYNEALSKITSKINPKYQLIPKYSSEHNRFY